MERCTVVPYEGEQEYLFISYSHKDSARINPIIERLAKEGYRIWYDEGIDPGSEWPEIIAKHLSNASACIGFISNNYLASDNCRRELNFSLKRHIPYLSIMLEEVQLSAGVEMQLSINQAIFKYKLPSDKLFYEKINVTSMLQASRTVPERRAESTVANVLATTEETSSRTVQISASPPKEPDSNNLTNEAKGNVSESPSPKKRKNVRKKALLFGTIGFAIIIIGVIIVFSNGNRPSINNTKVSDDATSTANKHEADEAPSTVDKSIADEAPSTADKSVADEVLSTTDKSITDEVPSTTDGLVAENLLLDSTYSERVLWGRHTSKYDEKDEFIKNSNFFDLSLENGLFNVSALPYEIEVRRDEHPEIARLYFYNKVGTEYIVQAAFSIGNNQLSLSPCGKIFEDAKPLAKALTYGISWDSSSLSLESATRSTMTYAYNSDVLQGAADSVVYEDIQAVDLQQLVTGADCTIYFTDGGHTKDAKVVSILGGMFNSLTTVSLSWTQEERLYNGSMVVFDTKNFLNNTCSLTFYNTYPYGFLLIENNNVYFYQKPLSE